LRRVADQENDDASHPSFYEGRLLVEILSWDWGLHLGVSRVGPRKDRFQGGLDRVRTIRLEGRIQAPREHRGRGIKVGVTPFGPEMRFGGALESVGSLHLFRSTPGARACEASLLLPEADLALLAVALSTTTRYLHIWTPGLDVEVARITDYSLSSSIGEKVKPWAGLDCAGDGV
jgi:hypothetical protein